MNDTTRQAPVLAEGAERVLETLGVSTDSVPPQKPLPQPQSRGRRPPWLIPSILFIATLLSMAWAGITAWSPLYLLELSYNNQSLFELRRHVLANWLPGILFSVSLTVILGAHELGHYFASKLYHIKSSLPIFIPFPLSPVGTCGAVILMDGMKADRKQIFDIGLAGPLAGLVFAIPIAGFGLMYGSPPKTRGTSIQFGQPLVIQWLAYGIQSVQSSTADSRSASRPRPDAPIAGELPLASRIESISNESMNPMLMAAWVGFLVTGLNMVPISQLDGGHVIFGLLGPKSSLVAWIAYLLCCAYVIYSSLVFGQSLFLLMLILIPLMGISHPPSRNDDVDIGISRKVIGAMSLAIPLLCIPFRPIVIF